MLIDDGYLRRDNGAWTRTADIRTLSVPPTIQALLSARLDLLAREERAVIEPASVVGGVFQLRRSARWSTTRSGTGCRPTCAPWRPSS